VEDHRNGIGIVQMTQSANGGIKGQEVPPGIPPGLQHLRDKRV